MSTDPPLSPFLDPQVYFGEDFLDPTLTSVMSSSDLYMNGTNHLSQNTSSSSSFSTSDTGTSLVLHNGYKIDQPLANTNFQNQMVSDLAIPSNALYNQTYAPWENQPYVPLANPTFTNPYSQDHLQMNSDLAIPSNALYNQTYVPWDNQPYVPLANPYSQNYLQMGNEMLLPWGNQPYVPLANPTLAKPYPQDYLQMSNEMLPWENQPYVPLANPALANLYPQDYLQMSNEMLPWGNQPYVPLANPTLANPYPQAYLQMTNGMLPLGTQPYGRIRNPRREEQLRRYFVKKHRRKFGKQIRYQSRKNVAENKRRMRGKFVKAGAEFDYDPTANNT